MLKLPVRRPRADYRQQLGSFLEGTGPFLSVYLDVTPGPQRRSARQRLLAALDEQGRLAGLPLDPAQWSAAGDALNLVADDDATLVALIDADGRSLVTGYPEPPRCDLVVLDHLPRLGPLLQAEQSLVHHVVAVVDGGALGLATVPRHGEPEHSLLEFTDGATIPPLIQRAARVSQTALVVVCAPETELPWLESQVRAGLPIETSLAAVPIDGRDDGDLAADIVVRCATHVAAKTVELIRLWRFHHAHDEAVDGIADAVAAINTGRAGLILVNDDIDDDRRAGFGMGPLIEPHPHGTDGTGQLGSARLPDVVIRAGLLTGVPLHVVPSLDATLADGIGVILADRSTPEELAAVLER